MDGPGEEVLSGGYSTPVVRVEDTVRRATGPWSPAVHGLLRHLERQDFDGAPRFLGLDDTEGRSLPSSLARLEITRWLPTRGLMRRSYMLPAFYVATKMRP